MSADVFGGPAGRGKATEDGIELDRWNRYLLPDPGDGQMRPWTRVSTVARTLDDTYNLDLWKQRMVAHGMSMRADLVALAASVEDPRSEHGKTTLNDVAARALDVAGGTARRDTGTALHAFTANHDRGTPRPAPPHLRADLDAYADAMRGYGLTALPNLIERVTCVPHYGIAGRWDRIVHCPDGAHRILDVKTGYTVDYGHIYFVIQCKSYALGAALGGIWDTQDERWKPCPVEIDPDMSLILHLPSGAGRASLHAVDLRRGIVHIERALAVRESRKEKDLVVELPRPTPPPGMHTVTPPASEPAVSSPASVSRETPIGPPTEPTDAPELALDAVEVDEHTAGLPDGWTRTSAGRVAPKECDRCGGTATGWVVCWYGCGHDQCDSCAETTAVEAAITASPPWTPPPGKRIEAATELGHLAALWDELHPQGLWTPELERQALDRSLAIQSAKQAAEKR